MKLKEFIKKYDMDMFLFLIVLPVCLILIAGFITLRVGDIKEVPRMVESDGFCKMTYGDNWDYNEKENLCFDAQRKEPNKFFTEQEFRTLCPKIKFTELKLFSDCFKSGDSRT